MDLFRLYNVAINKCVLELLKVLGEKEEEIGRLPISSFNKKNYILLLLDEEKETNNNFIFCKVDISRCNDLILD